MKKKEVVKAKTLTDDLEHLIKEWHQLKIQDLECNINTTKEHRDIARDKYNKQFIDICRRLGIKLNIKGTKQNDSNKNKNK